MKKLIVAICLLGCLASCGGGKKQADDQNVLTEAVDSMEIMADSLWVEEVEEEPVVPVSADESFADFLYNFATNERLQLRRILFPLPYYMDNRKDSIAKVIQFNMPRSVAASSKLIAYFPRLNIDSGEKHIKYA